jgi:rhamnose utilization protein RhaD (predicted bifunctional aldolase and dehydrogenase)
MEANLKTLIEISRRYGSDPDFVLVGGGNTSFKDDSFVYVKASGQTLGTIEAEGFVKMDRKLLDAIWTKDYPKDVDEREKQALADLMAARVKGEEKRPSVETLMHGLFPQTYVVHTHPALANGITCGQKGEEAVARLFPGKAVWLPEVNPGYILASSVRDLVEGFKARNGAYPSLVFMQNHGIVVVGESAAEIDAVTHDAIVRIGTAVARRPDFQPVRVDGALAASVSGRIRELGTGGDPWVLFQTNVEALRFLRNRKSFAPVSSAYTPDHIVYCGHEPLYVEAGGSEAVLSGLETGWADYVKRNGKAPKLVAVRGLGFFACGKSASAAEAARLLFLDAMKVAVYAESFGGHRFMSDAQIAFIRDWEVEKYRAAATT